MISPMNENFVKKAIQVHGSNYDYSKVEYDNSMNHVIINCQKHGDFMQLPMTHLKGSHCPRCPNVN